VAKFAFIIAGGTKDMTAVIDTTNGDALVPPESMDDALVIQEADFLVACFVMSADRGYCLGSP
jgi:hypothetical protein